MSSPKGAGKASRLNTKNRDEWGINSDPKLRLIPALQGLKNNPEDGGILRKVFAIEKEMLRKGRRKEVVMLRLRYLREADMLAFLESTGQHFLFLIDPLLGINRNAA